MPPSLAMRCRDGSAVPPEACGLVRPLRLTQDPRKRVADQQKRGPRVGRTLSAPDLAVARDEASMTDFLDNLEKLASLHVPLSPAVVRSLVEVAKAARAFGHLQKELRHKTFAPDETHTPCSMRLSHINELADALTRLEEQGNSQ